MEYIFGSDKITVAPGSKNEKDYTIIRNRTRIDDKEVFDNLFNTIESEEDAKSFLNHIANCKALLFKQYRIETNPSPVDINVIYSCCSSCKIKEYLKEFLFIFLLRCDIDNICYAFPLNGCIRIFTQFLLVLAYKYKWEIFIDKNNIPADIAQDVYDVGFAKGQTNYFQTIYELYLKNK